MCRQLAKGADPPELKAFADGLYDHENALRDWLKSELDGKSDGVLAPVWCGQIVVRSCQVVARAFAFIWSNSAWVIVPASRSCLADAI
jgi:hypothetical protein